jgi:hypothetical protein
MSHVSTVFQQLLCHVPRHLFDSTTEKFKGNRYTKKFQCWSQFIANLYAQLASKDSLRDIEIGLRTQRKKWYHLGLITVARSTLADANEKRDYRIYETLFHKLLARCKDITPKHKFRFKNPLLSIDSTLLFVCLSLYPWARFAKQKGAFKLHYLLDHRGGIPSFMVMTPGRDHEMTVIQTHELPLVPDSILVMDKGYLDFGWLYTLDSQGIFFVTRMKKNVVCQITGQHKDLKGKGVLADETIRVDSYWLKERYPKPLRRVTFYDEEHDHVYEFLTNNFTLAASTIAKIYKDRWKIELFFKWIKQHLKIKTFLGTSENAVLTQIWTAMIAYLLLAYIKYQTKYNSSLLELSRMIQSTLFDKTGFMDLLSLDSRSVRKIKLAWEQLTFT